MDITKLEDFIREALKSIEKLQFHSEKTDTGVTRIATKPLQCDSFQCRLIPFKLSTGKEKQKDLKFY
ncbi:unnamed protein product [Rotaria sordida]|uniref:Uncharacterized protein n=1 Tax=Rotaria sordida TaxID=392033 RepID=A0A814YDT0_9BILA|nr:unnamed protein product [Rotaria sordida]CAF1227643.1 unnamed protein product [Rotaria sordida]